MLNNISVWYAFLLLQLQYNNLSVVPVRLILFNFSSRTSFILLSIIFFSYSRYQMVAVRVDLKSWI